MRIQSKNASGNGTQSKNIPAGSSNNGTPATQQQQEATTGSGDDDVGKNIDTTIAKPEHGQVEQDNSYSRNNVQIENLVAGCKVQTHKDGQIRLAEILAIHTKKGNPIFYVHYKDYNKRLDEWVDTSHFDLSLPVEYPKPDRPKRSASTASKSKSKDNKKKSNKVSKTKASGKENTTPKQEQDDEQEEEEEGVMDLDKVHPQNGVIESLSRDEEIEKLRTGGSMTQNSHEVARIRNLAKIQMGKFEVEPWYFSPYPVELTQQDMVFICEFCLSYFGSKKQFERHRYKCQLQHPPGNEIYRDDAVSFFEIDGRRQRQWCRNLCLLSKLFLDHKTLYYDVDPFLFYCMTNRDHLGHHLIGYFSKEKESAEQYNVACILTLPQYQREGYGKLLIAFSYMLSKKEGKLGSPEKPLSDLGLLSYRAFWADTIVEYLIESKDDVTIDDIAQNSAMTTNDILHTLQHLNMLRYYKGQHIIVLTNSVIQHRDAQKKRRKRTLDPSKLQWKPPVFTAAQLRFAW